MCAKLTTPRKICQRKVSRSIALILVLLFFPGSDSIAGNGVPPTAPGELVDVGGYRVHLYCTGMGSPTVLIVGGFSFDWELVQPTIAKLTRVCTYDVSGTAWSDPGPSLQCLDRVNEVHNLVGKARIERPFVFVGFSIGALVGRRYTSLYPGDVVGMVIVDHAFLPRNKESFSPQSGGIPQPGSDSPPVLIEKTPIVLSTEDTSDFQKLPERVQQLQRWAESRKPALATAETAENCVSELNRKMQSSRPLGHMPLVVISTGNSSAGYAELQQELLSLSTNSQQLTADRSFHSVEIDQPEVVISGIKKVLRAIQQNAAAK